MNGQYTFYQDGAWFAIDEHHEAIYDVRNGDYENPSLQDVYTKQLVKRFASLRKMLRDPARHASAEQSGMGVKRSSSARPPTNRHEWLYVLDREYPTVDIISGLDEKSIKRGLEYCVYALDRFDTISDQKSCWIWTLLALSSDIGTLDSRNMSHIRDLGIKASHLSDILCQRGLPLAFQTEDDLLIAKSAGDGSDTYDGTDNAGSYTADVEYDTLETVNESSGSRQGAKLAAEYTIDKLISQTQNAAQAEASSLTMPNPSGDTGDSLYTSPEITLLERARARLLAQLGDNLVQTGMPASAQVSGNTNGTCVDRHKQTLQSSDNLHHETRKRAIPSRAEAERQRQLLRNQAPARDKAEEKDLACGSCHHNLSHAAEDYDLNLVDSNTKVTIDMILIVVAECYGQKDLLRSRKSWK